MSVKILKGAIVDETAILEDQVEIGYNAVVLSSPEAEGLTHICAGVIVGANATINPGIRIGHGAIIKAGSVVSKDVPANAVVIGNPGVIAGYVTDSVPLSGSNTVSDGLFQSDSIINLDVGNCVIYKLPIIPDMRGSLSVAEYEQQIPFIPKRCFWVFDVPSREIRGEHAHKALHQYLICVKGSVNVIVDDGRHRKEVALNKPNLGLHIPPLVWGVQYKYSPDAVLLVLASDAYDASDYLRNYEEFVTYVNDGRL